MKKFNPKIYQGKRVEKAVNSNAGISKIWVWNADREIYEPPNRGKSYRAVRIRTNGSLKLNESAMFSSLDEAREWRISVNQSKLHVVTHKSAKFADVIKDYEKNHLPTLRPSTQDSYQKIISKYLVYFNDIEMNQITPALIDSWIFWMKEGIATSRRMNFRHEYSLLLGVFKFYQDKDDNFNPPTKPRHRKSISVKKNDKAKQRDKKYISFEDFLKFREELKIGVNGNFYFNLATVQYFSALRISEATALSWDDIFLDMKSPQESKIRVRDSIYFKRGKKLLPTLQTGFKNSDANNGYKDIPLFRQSYECLLSMKNKQKGTGLIFLTNEGKIPTYREIQYAYDSAFERIGLKYTGTHILRHGGATFVYNISGGDLSLVEQITGNTDHKSIKVYAHRESTALKKLATSLWNKKI